MANIMEEIRSQIFSENLDTNSPSLKLLAELLHSSVPPTESLFTDVLNPLKQMMIEIRGTRPTSGDAIMHIVLDFLESLIIYEPEVTFETIRAVIVVVEEIGNTLTLNTSFVRLFSIYRSVPPSVASTQSNAMVSDVGENDVAVELLKCIRSIVRLEGPESYFRFEDVPLHTTLPASPASDSKGYTVTFYVRFSKFSSRNRFGMFSFLSESGAGIQSFLNNDEIEVKSPNSAHEPRLGDLSGSKFPHKFSTGRWYFLAFVHTVNSLGGQAVPKVRNVSLPGKMSLFVDSKLVASISVPYPPCPHDDIEWTFLTGGFQGDLGSFHLFGNALAWKQIRSIYESSPSYSPEFLYHKSFDLARFISLKQITSGFISGTMMRLTARSADEDCVLPDSWMQPLRKGGAGGHFQKEKVITRQPDGVQIVILPNHKKILHTKGGVKLLLFGCSPQSPMRGRRFYSAVEASEVFRLISDAITENPALLHQVTELGIVALKQYIMRQISYQMRGLVLLEGVLHFMYTLEGMLENPNDSPELFVDAFKYLLCDMSYWRSYEKDELLDSNEWITIKNICSICGTIIQTRRNDGFFKREISLTFFFNMIRNVCKEYFRTTSGKKYNPSSKDYCLIAGDILACASLMIQEDKDIHADHMEELAFLIGDCTKAELKLELMMFLLNFVRKNATSFASVFLPKGNPSNIFEKKKKGALLQVFIDNLDSPLEQVRICSIKLLGVLLLSIPGGRRQSLFAQEIAAAMDLMMGSLTLTPVLFDALLELAVSNVRLTLDSSSVLDEMLFIHFPCFLDVIFRIAQHPTTNISLRERVLLDVLTLLKTNEKNILQISHELFWQRRLVKFLDSFSLSKYQVTNQLVSEILQTVLWSNINEDQMGWTSVDSTIWCMEQSVDPETVDFYSLEVKLALQILTKLNRAFLDYKGSSQVPAIKSIIPDTSTKFANLKMTFLLFEKWIFVSPKSFLFDKHSPSEDELQLCSRFFQAVMGYMISDERKLHVIRVSLRFLSEILIHPDCDSLFDESVAFVRELFLDHLDGFSSDNISAVRYCMILLNKAHNRFLREAKDGKVAKIRIALVDLYRRWGPPVFNDIEQSEFGEVSPMEERKGSVSKSTVSKRFTWQETSHLKSNDNLYEEVTLFLAQFMKDDITASWYSDLLGKFNELLKSRQMKIEDRMITTRDQYETKIKEVEMRTIDNYFNPDGSEVVKERWADGFGRLQAGSSALWKHETEQLYVTGKVLKHFATDVDTRVTQFEELSNIHNRMYASGVKQKFWKLDRTENPLRQRQLLRRNLKGHTHKKSANQEVRMTISKKRAEIQLQDIKFNEITKSAIVDTGSLVGDPMTPTNSGFHGDTEDNRTNSVILNETEIDDYESSTNEEDDSKLQDDSKSLDSTSTPTIRSKRLNRNSSGTAAPSSAGAGSAISNDVANDGDILTKQGSSEARVLMTLDCVLITPLKLIEGKAIISEKDFTFRGDKYSDVVPVGEDAKEFKSNTEWSILPEDSQVKPDEQDPISNECYGISGLKRMKIINIPFKHIRQVLPRRYLLRESGLEIFLSNFRSYLFNFEKSKRNEVFRTLCDHLRLTGELKSHRRFEYTRLTEKWKNREISNFEYLMWLNTFAGRSFNDITQYPVFPWIIKDYTSEHLDLSNPNIYRDLSKPIGALNPERCSTFLEKYAETSRGDLPAWHYGSHYSSAGTVLFYLIRLEPYTSLNVYHQGGRFDLPDRLFYSLPSAWDLSFTSFADVKELIPEFFFLPEFLVNSSNLNLGTKFDKSVVNDVILPPWAKSVHHFIEIHREALESEYVSQHLHEWIDLIFGFKQRGPEAVKAINVFFHLTYEGSVDIDAIEDPAMRKATESQVINFGQTPSQLFYRPHPSRDSIQNSHSQLSFPFEYPVNYRPILVYKYERVEVDGNNFLKISSDGKLVHVTHQAEAGVTVFTHNISGIIQQIIKVAQGESSSASNVSTLSTATGGSVSAPVLTNQTLVATLPVHIFGPEWKVTATNVSKNGLFLFSGGYRNRSLKAHLIENGMPLASVHGHCEVITCISTSHDNTSVVTGAKDGTVTLWLTSLRKFDHNRLPPLMNGETHIFGEHSEEVLDVSHNLHLGIIASISRDQTCVLYSSKRKRYIRTIVVEQSLLLKKVYVCQYGRIIVYGLLNSLPVIFLYTTNGELVSSVYLKSPMTVICSAGEKEWILIGDESGFITIYKPALMEIVQEIDCCKKRLGQKSSRLQQARILKRVIHSLDVFPGDKEKDDEEKKNESFNQTPPKSRSDTVSTGSRHSGGSAENKAVAGVRNDAALDDLKDLDDEDTLSELKDEEEDEDVKSVERCAVKSVEVSPQGHYFAVCMENGNLLLYVLPNLMGLAQFDMVFNTLKIDVKKPVFIYPDDALTNSSRKFAPESFAENVVGKLENIGDSVSTAFGTFGKSIKKGFGGFFKR